MKILLIIAAIIAAVYISIFAYIRSDYKNGYSIETFNMVCYDRDDKAIFDDEMSINDKVAYGWICKVKTTVNEIKWRESLTIPVKPEIWENNYLESITNDGRTANCSGNNIHTSSQSTILDTLFFVKTAYIEHSWGVAKGDPTGDYNFIVSIGDTKMVRTLIIK